MPDQGLSKSQQERMDRARSNKWRKVRNLTVWLLFIVLVVVGVWRVIAYSKKAQTNKPGVEIPDQGANHIQPGQEQGFVYNSNPPTSGPHFPTWAPWGAHEEILADQLLIHNLEHGGVWIAYKNPENKDLAEKLKTIVSDFSVKVVLTPRPQNDSEIAVAAWDRILELETFDEKQIREFIKAFINKGPEQTTF